MDDFKVIIIGGGLAGSLLANGLLNNGIKFRLYERDSRDAIREGYHIRLGDPAIKGFNACLSNEQHLAILRKFGKSSGASSTAPSLYTSQYKMILDLTTLKTYTQSSAINRETLRSLLAEPIDTAGHLQYGANFTHCDIINQDGRERVRVNFADGSSDEGDIVIGSDGSGSKINENLELKNIVPLTSHWSFLSKGSLPYRRIESLPAQLQKGPIITFSKGTSFFYACRYLKLRYPVFYSAVFVDFEPKVYLPETQASGQKNDSKLMYDEEEASFFWGLNIPKVSITDYKDYSHIPDKAQFCLDYIKEWAPEFHTMISTGFDDSANPSVVCVPLRASKKPSRTWRSDAQKNNPDNPLAGHPRIWILGDAIHAMQPNRGMGGNQALMDCAELLPCLIDLNNLAKSDKLPSTEQVQLSCTRYEEKMIERAFSWVKKSGGHSFMALNFDGILGHVIWCLGKILVPLVSLLYGIFGSS